MPEYSAVAELFARYAAAMDDKDFDTLHDVFAEDATFTVDITDGPTVGPYESRDNIVEFISTTTKEQQDQRRHVITNVRREDDVAYGILSLLVTDAGELTAQATGVYRTDLVQEDDALRFASMYLTLDRPY